MTIRNQEEEDISVIGIDSTLPGIPLIIKKLRKDMSDSVSKYYDDLEDKAFWAAKELENQSKNRFERIHSFFSKLFNFKIKK